MKRRVIIQTAFLICTGITLGHTQQNLDIFLLIGQSNMAGRAPMDSSIRQDTAVIPNTWLLKDSAVWIGAKNPLNLYSTYREEANLQQIGPGHGFALALQKAMPGRQIGLVVQARGGTSITDWGKPDTHYINAVSKARQAMKSGTLRAVLWHQGESDKSATSTYLVKITALIAALRQDLGIDTLPFIASQLLTGTKYASFNAMIVNLPAKVSRTAVVLTDNTMKSIGDDTHFNRDAQLKLGTRYAEKVLAMVNFGTTAAAPALTCPFRDRKVVPIVRFGNPSESYVYMKSNGKFYNMLGRFLKRQGRPSR